MLPIASESSPRSGHEAGPRRERRALAAVVLGAMAACSPSRDAESVSGRPARPTVTSNVTRGDYAGSDACASCHADVFARWKASPMREMTRAIEHARIAAPFDGSRFEFMGDAAVLSTHEGRRYLRLVPRSGETGALYRVTKVIGGRTREDFAGVEVGSKGAHSGALGDDRILPVSYLKFSGEWRYKGYSVMSPERPGLRVGSKWRTTCIFCHNTVAQLSTFFDDMHGPGAPGYQGAASVELPDDRALRFEVTDEALLRTAVEDEIEALEAPPIGSAQETTEDVLVAAMKATRRKFDQEHLIEQGIGCEACHGGSRQHVERPSLRPTFTPTSGFFRVTTSDGREPGPAESINRSCAKCHTVLFTRYAYTWEGGSRSHAPGGGSMNSGEARNFLMGGCASAMACTTCHDPHGPDDPKALRQLATPAGNRVCVGCHEEKSGADALRAHSHHEPTGAGGACIACHMPQKNVGLAYDLTRYHRIGSPTDRERVEQDRPLECALCHDDRSVRSLVEQMEAWWNVRYDRQRIAKLYGPDLGVNVLSATLARGRPHEQVVAVAIAGRKRVPALLPLVTAQLRNEFPLIRFYAKEAIGRIVGKPMPVDAHLPADELYRDARRWVAQQ